MSVVGWFIFIVATLGQVVARYVFGSALSWADEIARLSLIWFTFLCALELAIVDEHIAIEVFKPDGVLGRFLAFVKYAAIGATGVMLAYGAWKLYPVVSISKMPATGIPSVYMYLAAAVAGGGFILIAVLRMAASVFDLFMARRRPISR
ncbi:tripartite AtP-independent periplasmic transporter subunit DctQ [Salinisphaera sp. T31B1]